ncbi:MAG: hypothetical protein AAF221_11930 [Pseudomonadota bacterium]
MDVSNYIEEAVRFAANERGVLFSGIGTGVICYIATKSSKLTQKRRSTYRSKRKVSRHWHGAVSQTLPWSDTPEISTCHIEFHPRRSLAGLMRLHFPADAKSQATEQVFRLRGKNVSDRKFSFEYCNTKIGILQAGILQLDLSSDNRTFRGTYAGFGPITDEPICGKINLTAIHD